MSEGQDKADWIGTYKLEKLREEMKNCPHGPCELIVAASPYGLAYSFWHKDDKESEFAVSLLRLHGGQPEGIDALLEKWLRYVHAAPKVNPDG